MKEKLRQLQDDRRSLKRKLEATKDQVEDALREHGVTIQENLSDDFRQILQKEAPKFEEGSLQSLFWKQQQESLGRDKRGIRWHPSLIKLCIGLHAKPPACYKALSDSGVLILPSSKTLRHYTMFTKPMTGFL